MGLFVGLLEYSGTLQLLLQHEDALFKRGFIQWVQDRGLLRFLSHEGWDSFSHIFFLSLDENPHIYLKPQLGWFLQVQPIFRG